MGTYFTKPPTLIDGDTAFAADVNVLSNRVDAAFILVEAATIGWEPVIAAYTDIAEAWAQNPEDIEVDSGQYSALHHAAKALASANTAISNASTTTTQAGIATSGASTATTQAGIATTQAANALISRNAADADVVLTNADVISSASNASTATTQAGLALTRANTATAQANIAIAQAGIATTKATESAASAIVAETQAGIATAAAAAALGLPYEDNIAALVAYTGDHTAAYVRGRSTDSDGGQGIFIFDSSDLSLEVSADTLQGIYVSPSTDLSGVSGAWVRQFDTLLPEFFGAVTDWNGVTGTDNRAAFNAMFLYAIAHPVREIKFSTGDYFLGSHSTNINLVSVVGLQNTTIYAHGSRFITNTTAIATPFMFAFINSDNLKWEGGRFFDVGFDASVWAAHERQGAAAIRLYATVASENITIQDIEGEDLTYLVIADQRLYKRLLSNIKILNCKAKNCYYGVDAVYVGDNLRISNLICYDVRRGFIGFGTRNADIDIRMESSSGFFGSNGFISLACEGEDYNDGSGAIGLEANSENVRIDLNVSGYESHNNLVHFYHQQADCAGHLSNFNVNVLINNLSASGKHASVGDTNVFMFDHELPSGAILGSSSRTISGIYLDGSVIGTVSGSIIKADSYNVTTPFELGISPSLTEEAHAFTTSVINQYTTILTPYEKTLSLVPVGATSAGTASGLIQMGSYSVISNRVFFNAQVTWTGHTGTGTLRLSGLPIASNDTQNGVQPVQVVVENLSHTGNIKALIGGAAGKQVILYSEEAGVLTALPMDTSAIVRISGSYLGV
jgi:hypothetical protein